MHEHQGKLFFDFEIPEDVDSELLEACQKKVEREIDRVDPWCNGENERKKWLDLHNVPSDHAEMHIYLNKKIKEISGDFTIQQDSTAPITYCYSGESRICYHPHPVYLYGTRWTVKEKRQEMKMLLVLTYKTKCFPVD